MPERLSARSSRGEFAADRARALHHHVFDTELVVRLVDRAGLQLIALETALPFHIVAFASVSVTQRDNSSFLSDTAGWRY